MNEKLHQILTAVAMLMDALSDDEPTMKRKTKRRNTKKSRRTVKKKAKKKAKRKAKK